MAETPLEFELLPIEYSADEQHRSGISNIISKLPDRQNTSSDKKSWKNLDLTYNISKTRRRFCSCIRSSKMNIFAVVLFISLSITAGVLTVCFTTPKRSTTCQLTFKRMMISSIISSSQPRAVAIADFNNDHKMDIVVANFGTDTIGIFLAKGNGTFAQQKTYPIGSQSRPCSIVVSHFNHDNHLDIAVANYGTNNIGIFLGNGNGTFIDQKVFSLGSSRPLFLSIGDFNKDNRTDLVVVNYGTNSIGILFGYGNGSFEGQMSYSTGDDSIPYSLAVGDLNNDTHVDIVVANYGTNNIGIFLGYGNGKFTSQKLYSTFPQSNPSSIALGDFNNDNKLDIVVSNNGTGNIGIFFGHGNGTFLAQITYLISSNSHPQYITVDDLNKDNALDIVIVDSTKDQVHILPGYGNGSFGTITTYDTISESGPFWVAVADLKNNNQSAIVVVNHNTNDVLVLINYSTKPSARQVNYNIGPSGNTGMVVVSDFNNDQILDIASNGDQNLIILTGLGNGTFNRGTTLSTNNGSNIQYIGVGDLNNDKRMDIVITDVQSDSVGVFLGHGDGTFSKMISHSTGTASQPWWIALGDFNHDNVLDIACANTDSHTIGILLGNGDGTFVTTATYSTGQDSYPYSVAVGDVNNDTHLDFVVANGDGSVIVFLGHDSGTFTKVGSYFIGSGLISIALADLNSDNHLDIVVADELSDNVRVLLGYENGTFAAQANYSTGSGSQPGYVIVADINNDNIYDIAATNSGNDEVIIFYGYGNGSFELARTYSTGFGSKPYGITASDVNNDKQLELIVGLWGTGDIAVLTAYDAAHFGSQKTYSTGSTPQSFSVAVGDFNNDNRSDMVVANSGTDNLDILLNSYNGTFDMEMVSLIGTDRYPQYVITCDINNDNRLDIVSVNSKDDSINIIMGNGNGTFAEKMRYSTGNGSRPYAVTSDDFNNDHRLDLVIVNKGTNSIGVLFGFDYTTFQNQTRYSSIDNIGPASIIVSDFNNDNFLDIAVVFYNSDSLGILLGYGNGSFAMMMTYSTEHGSEPRGIAAGDLNNDGRMDIVVADRRKQTVGVLLGYGNGSFPYFIMTLAEGYYKPYAIAVGHFDDDDRLDIVVADHDTDSIGVLLGYGNGSFYIANIYPTGRDSSPIAVTVGDFNNDGRSDIAVAYTNTDSVGVLLGYRDGKLDYPMTFSTGSGSRPFWVAVGDFNSDNQLDIATANGNSNNVGILLGYGNGTFAPVMTYSMGTSSLPQCISVGDFNNDKILDIAVANSGTNDVVVLFGFGDGSFLLGTPYSTGIGSIPVGLVIGDFNNDTQMDIAVANSVSSDITVLLAYDRQPFGSMRTYSTGDISQPHSVATGDLNKDGRLDIVVANYGTDNIGIFLGSNNAVFDHITTYPTGTNAAPYSVAVADFNDDHQLDIVVTNSETDNIIIFFGYGNGTFAIGLTYSTGTRSRPYTVAIGDLNNDNRSDIIVANSGTSNVFILYGNTDGTFENETSYPLGYGYHPYSIAVKDLNQDDWLDIAIACYDTDHVETLIKMC